MDYDHRAKAGNFGDLFKQLALTAAVTDLKQIQQPGLFKYADLYAGLPAFSLTQSKRWRKGIGRLQDLSLPTPHRVFDAWRRFTLGCLDAPDQILFPGPAELVRRLTLAQNLRPEMRLWESSPHVCEALASSFVRSTIECTQPQLKRFEPDGLDLLFISPPGLSSNKFPHWPHWNELSCMLAHPVNTLMWLPIVETRKLRHEHDHRAIRHSAICLDMSVTEIYWRGRTMVGCQLIYRLPAAQDAALKQSTAYMAQQLPHCSVKHFPEWRTVRV